MAALLDERVHGGVRERGGAAVFEGMLILLPLSASGSLPRGARSRGRFCERSSCLVKAPRSGTQRDSKGDRSESGTAIWVFATDVPGPRVF